MLSLFRKKDAPLQLYGKLPLARDYLRVGCGDGLAKALRGWMDESFSTGLAADERRELQGPVRFFVADGSKALQGLLLPSSDAAGLRSFPFLVAVDRGTRDLTRELREAPLRTFALWNELERRAATYRSYEDAAAFLAAMRQGSLTLDELRPTPPPAIDVLAWTEALWPDEGVHGLAPVLAALRSWKGAELALPLAPSLPLETQAAAWLAVCVEAGHLGRGALPRLVLPLRDGHAGYLSLAGGTFDADLARRLAVLGPAFEARESGPVEHALGEALLHAFQNA